ncbi:MAG: hypothetical protein WCK17_05140 [Verrucomicrobiota bacterium]
MLVHYDLDAGQWVQAPGSRYSPAKPGFIRGDSAAITLKFCRGAAVVELDAAATASLGVKQDGKFDGSYLASTGTVVVANHSKAITSTAYGDPATTFLVPGHGRAPGETVTISGDTSTPPANGIFTVTVTDADHFSVPFTTTVDGTRPPSLPYARPRSDRIRCVGRESKFLADIEAMRVHTLRQLGEKPSFVLKQLQCRAIARYD